MENRFDDLKGFFTEEEVKAYEEKSSNAERTINTYEKIEPRHNQIWSEDALKLDIVDLFKDEDGYGHKHLSRADIILIFTLYKDGINGFYEEYMEHVKFLIEDKKYRVVIKPHYYLKNIIG